MFPAPFFLRLGIREQGTGNGERVQVGVLLPTRQAVMASRGGPAPIDPILQMAERAEVLGFDSVWIGDSITAHPRFDCITTMAAVAARTRRVKVGSAVLLSALRHPVVLAFQVANLDIIAGARIILGVGVGATTPSNERMFQACGVPFGRRAGIFEEGLVVMRRLWREPSVSFDGKHFQLRDVRLEPRPIQAGGPPLWIGGGSEPAMRRCGRLADGWFPTSRTPEDFAATYRRVQEVALQRRPLALAVAAAKLAGRAVKRVAHHRMPQRG